jgi:hypothetical protein
VSVISVSVISCAGDLRRPASIFGSRLEAIADSRVSIANCRGEQLRSRAANLNSSSIASGKSTISSTVPPNGFQRLKNPAPPSPNQSEPVHTRPSPLELGGGDIE